MAVSAAQLLDELMGKDRNRAPGEPSSRMHWSDNEVCKYFLCGFCPHELFTNTKADLGACPKVHDEALKKEYEKSSRRGIMGYEETFYRFLQGIMSDVERRIRRGHERLALNAKREQVRVRLDYGDVMKNKLKQLKGQPLRNAQAKLEVKNAKGDDEKLSMITDHINQLLGEIETLGSEGKVEEAQGVNKLVDQLKEEKETLLQMVSELALSKLNPLSSQEKQMEVCEVCGAFLIVGDAQSRVDDHLQGKQHVGYARIKAAVDDMKDGKWRTKIREEKEKQEKGTDEGDKESKDEKSDNKRSSREGSRRRDRDRSRERNRSRDRKDRNRDRNRDRDRDRDRDRSRDRRRERERDRRRSRSRDRRSRSKDRRKRSRDRRSRSGGRRSRSRDRYRGKSSRDRRRSRSRDRRKSRSRDRDRRRSRSRDKERRRSRSRSRERRRSRSGDRRSRSGSHDRGRKQSARESVESDGKKGSQEEGNDSSRDLEVTNKEEAVNGGDQEMQETNSD